MPRALGTTPTAIVTGAGSGIGAAVASTLANTGYLVVAADRAFGDGAPAESAQLWRVTADVVDPQDRRRIVERAHDAGGGVDLLVNNAGRIATGPPLSIEASEWDDLFEVNVKAPYAMCQLVAEQMQAKRYGVIINMCSIAAGQPSPSNLVYAATKAALLSTTFSLAAALAGSGVRVNAVCPGLIETPLTDATDAALAALRGEPLALTAAARRSRIPLGHAGSAQDVAGLVVFLASDAASFITGQAMHVNGGSRMTGW